MGNLRDLYQNAILDHYKNPRNYNDAENANRTAHGHNPLCGDTVNISLNMDNDRILDIGFTGSSCAIATASASMMTESLKGKTETEARSILKRFIALLTGQGRIETDPSLGNLNIFADVRGYPVRVKCALLAWHTFHAALEGKQDPVEPE
jgi:nitrogen fixation protein NifU and related proteins